MYQQRQPKQAEAGFSDQDASSSAPWCNQEKLTALAIECTKKYQARKKGVTPVLTQRKLSNFVHRGRTRCYMCGVLETLHLRQACDRQACCAPCKAKWCAMALAYGIQPRSPAPVPTEGAMAAVHVAVPLLSVESLCAPALKTNVDNF